MIIIRFHFATHLCSMAESYTHETKAFCLSRGKSAIISYLKAFKLRVTLKRVILIVVSMISRMVTLKNNRS